MLSPPSTRGINAKTKLISIRTVLPWGFTDLRALLPSPSGEFIFFGKGIFQLQMPQLQAAQTAGIPSFKEEIDLSEVFSEIIDVQFSQCETSLVAIGRGLLSSIGRRRRPSRTPEPDNVYVALYKRSDNVTGGDKCGRIENKFTWTLKIKR